VPDLVGRALGVLDARQADVDLVLARALQLRLGDTERVDAVAHDVQRAIEALRRDRRLLLGRPRLVDELNAPLQVETEARGLRGDHGCRRGYQPQDGEQDEEVATAVGHGAEGGTAYFDGVSTSRSPPSSS
jgi:hypothetical protein